MEDEIPHFLFNGSEYSLIRNNFYNKVKILIPNIIPLPHLPYQWTDEHILLLYLYYYMRNFCNLIGLEQWYSA